VLVDTHKELQITEREIISTDILLLWLSKRTDIDHNIFLTREQSYRVYLHSILDCSLFISKLQFLDIGSATFPLAYSIPLDERNFWYERYNCNLYV
jgi:hypothetical protein